MTEESKVKSEIVTVDDLQPKYLSLRIGEEIPLLKVQPVKKLTNPGRDDNLAGVNYKYMILADDDSILTVNSWTLWSQIASALKEAGKINVALELKHPSFNEYLVRVIPDGED